MTRYLVINQQFAQANENYTRDGMTFNYAITLQGDYVCAENSIVEFPELFENSPYLFGLPVVELTVDDFPAQIF